MSMENYKYIQDKLNNGKIVILDGANGSELEKRGAQMDRAGWCGPASITHPKILESIHKDYIAAGAEVITTNTFSSARHVLEYSTFKDQTLAINEKAMECALSARNHFPNKKIAIAGSISLSLVADVIDGINDPAEFRDYMKTDQRSISKFTEESIQEGSFNYNKILKNFNEQISIFKKYNIDLIILEMIINPSICKPAIDAALASGMPVWLGLSCGDESEEGNLFAFENSKMKFSETLNNINTNFDAVLLMHSETKNTTKGLQEIKTKWNGHIGAYPHKGTYVRPNWNFDKNYTPEMYSKDMQGWVNQGVRIIGSCCGMGPEYTYDLKKRFS